MLGREASNHIIKKFKSQPIVIGYSEIVKFFFTIFLPHYLSSFTISREFLHLVQLSLSKISGEL
jgi:DNA integrity scanning protein DisA with diadenylate cyclase activity